MRRRKVIQVPHSNISNCSSFAPDAKVDPLLESQFAAGRLYATISSRPGQSGRADGYVLEGKELEVRSLF
jgi:ribosomal protein S8E